MSDLPTALYDAAGGERFAPTGLTRGPWNPLHQHAGPPGALLARAIEARAAIRPGQITRLSYDILRPIPIEPLAVTARLLRPGRRVEQLEATLASAADGTTLMRVNAWRMRQEDVAGVEPRSPPPPPPGPEEGREGSFGFWRDPVAYHRALDWRFVEGGFDTPGPATVWTRLRVPLVAGEEPTALERMIVMADAASGVSAELDWESFVFVNVELGIHLERTPRGEWMCMAAQTHLGPRGAALCTSVLSDLDGRVGITTQSLLVARRAQ
ncbi:MAG: thioesterase family protein [Thermoleophilaceae bacterium]